MTRQLLLALLLPLVVYGYCPDFLRNQTACSCFAYVDGAVIRCNGSDGPKVIEQLKTSQTDIRELAIENANIVEVNSVNFSRKAVPDRTESLPQSAHQEAGARQQ